MAWSSEEVIRTRSEGSGSFYLEDMRAAQLACLEAKLAVEEVMGGLVLPEYDVIIDTVAQILIQRKMTQTRVLLLCEIKAIAFAVVQMYSTRYWAESQLDYGRRIL